MKVTLNYYASNLLVQTKARNDDKSFNQLLIEAMELLHEKYTQKVQNDQTNGMDKDSS